MNLLCQTSLCRRATLTLCSPLMKFSLVSCDFQLATAPQRNLTVGFLYRAGAETTLSFRETFRVSFRTILKNSHRWIPKPQFWYPPLRFGSQQWIPKTPIFFVFWAYTADIGFFSAWAQSFSCAACDENYQELSGEPNPQYFLKSTAVQMGGVLPYRWETYCSTNGRCTVAFPFLPGLATREAQRYNWGHTAVQIGGTAVLYSRPAGVVGFLKRF